MPSMNGNTKDSQHQRVSILVDDSAVHPLDARDSLGAYLLKLWKRRSFILLDARARAFQGHRGMWLGKLWIILNPLVEAATYGLIFGLLLRTSRGIDNFVGFLLIGIIFFGFLQQGLNSGAGLIRSNRAMIAAFRFPRASIAIGLVVRQFLDNLAPALMAVLVALVCQLNKPIDVSVICVVPLYILIHIFSLGLILFVSWLTAFVPDAKALLRVVSRGWFYISGVFFSVENFATHPVVRSVMQANPGFQFISSVRTAVLDGTTPDWRVWVSLLCWSFGSLAVGFLVFWGAESKYVKVI